MTRTLPAALMILSLVAPGALAQPVERTLDDDTGWDVTDLPEPGSDQAVLSAARAELARDNPERALEIITPWIKSREGTRDPNMPAALLIRGDARTASGSEFRALYDYEQIIREFPGSEAFPQAVEREYETGLRYANGLRRRFLGLRIENARTTGEEILIRVQERMPGSALAERAAIDLADHFYNRRRMKLAAEMYSIFLVNHTQSELREYAALREIQANISRFKGPEHDASGLLDARLLIQDFMRRYPDAAQREGITEGLLVRIDESAARKKFSTAKWYLSKKDEPSARFTIELLLERHPATAAARDAIDLMIDRGWIETEPAPDEDQALPDDGSPADEDPGA